MSCPDPAAGPKNIHANKLGAHFSISIAVYRKLDILCVGDAGAEQQFQTSAAPSQLFDLKRYIFNFYGCDNETPASDRTSRNFIGEKILSL
jgi:hypothetical protein